MAKRERIDGIRRNPLGVSTESDPYRPPTSEDDEQGNENPSSEEDESTAQPEPAAKAKVASDEFGKNRKGAELAAFVQGSERGVPIEELVPQLESLEQATEVCERFSSDFLLLRTQVMAGNASERATRMMEFLSHYVSRFLVLAPYLDASARKTQVMGFIVNLKGLPYREIIDTRSRKTATYIVEQWLFLSSAREMRKLWPTYAWTAPSWQKKGQPATGSPVQSVAVTDSESDAQDTLPVVETADGRAGQMGRGAFLAFLGLALAFFFLMAWVIL